MVVNIIPKREVNAQFFLNSRKIKVLNKKTGCQLDTTLLLEKDIKMKKILTFGVFDFFHLGHLRLFYQCKEKADYLIVAVQNGDYINKFKPEAKILYSTDERKEILGSLKIVDEVIVYDEVNINTLRKIDFDILALGEDHIGGRFDIVEEWCKQNGKEVVRLKRTPGITSSFIRSIVTRSDLR